MDIARIAAALGALVIASIVCHGMHLHHEHPAHMGEGISAALHSGDREIWLALLLSFIAWSMGALAAPHLAAFRRSRRTAPDRRIISDHLFASLRLGILSPSIP